MNAVFYCTGRALLAGRRSGVIPDRRACFVSPVPSAESPVALRRLSSIALSISWATCCDQRSTRRFL